MTHPARWWHPLPDGRIQCDLCPRECQLHEGQRAACFVRQREGNQMVLTTWGRSSGFCLDPIEKKPLNHFLPGSRILSFGTAGCNLTCKFCQNWDISKSHDMDKLMAHATPDAIAQAALSTQSESVAFTYNDPVIFAEYALDIAAACHARGVQTVAVTAGYIGKSARQEFFNAMDAANVDLKAFSENFYHLLCGAHLTSILDTLSFIHHETNCWLEITTLLIPGANDSDAEIEALSNWVARELSPEVPIHFTAFHPDFKLTNVPATPHATLLRAQHIARAQGLRHVYVGNVRDLEGAATRCTQCGTVLIVRDGYQITQYRLSSDGCCPDCGTALAGRFETYKGSFGNRRIPVRFTA
jgi:pyruvate formate lyase activating enzyme